jgi:hypothetical protein
VAKASEARGLAYSGFPSISLFFKGWLAGFEAF